MVGLASLLRLTTPYILDMGEFIYRHFTGDDMRYEKDLDASGT